MLSLPGDFYLHQNQKHHSTFELGAIFSPGEFWKHGDNILEGMRAISKCLSTSCFLNLLASMPWLLFLIYLSLACFSNCIQIKKKNQGAKVEGQLRIPKDHTLNKIITRNWRILLKCVSYLHQGKGWWRYLANRMHISLAIQEH